MVGTDMTVIVPTRGRPEAMFDLIETSKHFTSPATRFIFAVDDDDPKLDRYERIHDKVGHHLTELRVGPRLRMIPTLNTIASDVADGGASFIGFMGDDHRPRTMRWDLDLIRVLQRHGGVAYGDDKWQREALATAIFMDADLIRILGYMAPERQIHMYADNFWMLLGHTTKLTYLPGTVIEHMHPDAGKGVSDEIYASTNNPATYAHDQIEFERYVREDWPREKERIEREYRYPDKEKR